MWARLRQRWAFTWAYLRGRAPWDTGISPPELLETLSALPPGRALDLGCGTGTNALEMARRGWQVTGIDFALPAVRAARARLRQAGLVADLRQGDVTDLSALAGPYDFALDIGCFHNLSPEGRAGYRRGLERLLRPGARFLIYGFARAEGEGSARRGIGPGDLAAFEPGFRLVWRRGGTDTASQGERPSMWALLERV